MRPETVFIRRLHAESIMNKERMKNFVILTTEALHMSEHKECVILRFIERNFEYKATKTTNHYAAPWTDKRWNKESRMQYHVLIVYFIVPIVFKCFTIYTVYKGCLWRLTPSIGRYHLECLSHPCIVCNFQCELTLKKVIWAAWLLYRDKTKYITVF